MSEHETAVLDRGLSTLGLTADAAIIDRLLAYQTLLHKWNAAINLTAVRDPKQMVVQHLLDSLSVVRPFESRLTMALPRILDVGSGGGLPGVVLAIMRPSWDITCVDAVGKKVTFIRQVAAELRLSNLHAEHSRVEQLAGPSASVSSDTQSGFDLITSRAFASLHDFTRLTAKLGRGGDAGTRWAAMKGKIPDAEIEQLASPFSVFHVEQLEVPGLDADRCLVWLTDRPAAALLAETCPREPNRTFD